ncbi:MAG TPA: hypothetical protein VLF94_06170 [Chlamydiales bacterium]|nr:hypothetical protein [Chlamydiales bacterium]
MAEGIIVGSDQSQEWLLPWWWENYQRHNRHPVAFFDFGLSEAGKRWCRERGQWIKLAPLFVKERDEVAPSLAHEWESRYGDQFWNSREAWFKKPHACLCSPFENTVWLDLDCEVLGPLDPLFQACDHPSGIALARDQTLPTYNSGVIAFRSQNAIIGEWARQSLEQNGVFRGDQDLLSHIVAGKAIGQLLPIYNWNVGYGLNPEAVICHWLGERAKTALRNQLILNDL